jgi:CBS domain-containing protein
MASLADTFATPLAALHAVALDTETTGLDPARARIVQVGAVRLNGAALALEPPFAALVNPGSPIPPASTAIHGIADADVAGHLDFAALAPTLAAWLGDTVLIGHTIGFDLAILAREHARAGLAWQAPPALDIRHLARLARPGLMHDDLDRLCATLGVDIAGRHTATGDARATAEAYLALIPLLRARGIRTLAEALAAQRTLAERQPPTLADLAAPPLAAPPAAPPAALARLDSFPYRHRIAEVMSAPPVTLDPAAPVAAAIRTLSEHGASSAFLALPQGWGIVTERDVLRALDRHGAAALAMPAADFASLPLQTVPADAFVYRAIGRMARLGVRHLGVCAADGTLVGALTPRNLLRQRSSAALLLGDAIDCATSVAELGRAWAQVPLMVRLLRAEDVPAPQIAAVISAELCAMTRRAAELAEAAMLQEGLGPPPAPYCVLVLGSAGRGESLLAADQDNAIVHAGDGAGDGAGSEVDRWCAALATRMNALLDEAGIPFCTGGVMAREAGWRHSLAGWRTHVATWLRRRRPEDLLNVDIFFDAVPVHGDLALGETLRDAALAQARAAPDFLALLSQQAASWRAPLSFFGRLRRNAEGRTDLKLGGLLPLVAGARVLALRHGSPARATPERLRNVAARGIGAPSDIEAIIAAHAVLLAALLDQQLADAEAGTPLSPRIDPARPAAAGVPAALRQVATLVDLVTEGVS